ncbi:calmodulin [Colletotrichum karsti]|uniref:Calmodulin n=1 Tax=Colletotrichum karsti TaxID=1095194 RepID=A0A9P6IAY5_9PEZI|nr:calmodulin [Colletotrichum karsti]KAF9879007.1 calmodulin [Colletotrichum karsti]
MPPVSHNPALIALRKRSPPVAHEAFSPALKMPHFRLSEEQVKDYKAVFAAWDRDNTDSIDADEFQIAMKSLGLNPSIEEVKELMKEVDPKGKGDINLAEFLQLMSEAPAPSSKDTDTNKELVAAFKVFDKDNSGSVSPSELRQVLLSLGQRATDEEIEEMIRHADLDGNGSIDCELLPHHQPAIREAMQSLLCTTALHHTTQNALRQCAAAAAGCPAD